MHLTILLQDESEPDIVYYQWVVFMFLINAAIFMIPNYLWNMVEDGHIAIFCGDGTKCPNIAFGSDEGYVQGLPFKLLGSIKYYHFK